MSNIVPLQSSSPPPLTDDDFNNGEDEDDDEFGNFATASSSFPDFLSPTRNTFKPLSFSSDKHHVTATLNPDPSLSFSPPKIEAPLNDNYIPKLPPTKIEDSYETHNGNRTYKNGETPVVNSFFISRDKLELHHKQEHCDDTDIVSDTTFQNDSQTLADNCDDFEASPSPQHDLNSICDNSAAADTNLDDDFGSFSAVFSDTNQQQTEATLATNLDDEPNANSCIAEEQVPCPGEETLSSDTKEQTSTPDEPSNRSDQEGLPYNYPEFNEGLQIPSEEKEDFSCTFEANFEFKFDATDTDAHQGSGISDWATPDQDLDPNNVDLGDDEDDDFADFETAVAAPATQVTEEEVGGNDPNDEFTDFESVTFPPTLSETESTTTTLESPPDPYKTGASQIPQEVLENVFPSLSPGPEVPLQPLLEARSKIILERLQDLDTSPALTFSWPSSQAFQLFIKSLCIDSSLVNPSVPLFAAGLGLLEPTPADAQDDSSPAIPEAHFDWGQSGLVNPLESSSLSMLNLDFLTQELSKLEEEASSSATPQQNHVAEENIIQVPSLLTNLLVTPQSQPPTSDRELSEEAKAIVDHLPDLSFMQASVLMFPVLEAS